MATDYTRDEIDVLIDLIRRDNSNKILHPLMVSFGNPQVFTPTVQIDRNTMIVATARPGYQYRGSQTFYYNRVPLSKFVEPGVTDLTFDPFGKQFVSDLLPELNERLGTNLTANRIIDFNLPSIQDDAGGEDVLIQVLPASLVYKDSLLVKIVRDSNDLYFAIPDPQMDGLVYAAPAL